MPAKSLHTLIRLRKWEVDEKQRALGLLIREEEGGEASAFNEIWHLVKPLDGSREWAIAGIQQTH